jgi:hypothetical protein
MIRTQDGGLREFMMKTGVKCPTQRPVRIVKQNVMHV